MSLSPGARLGPYEIVALLGSGWMEVCTALGITKLDRALGRGAPRARRLQGQAAGRAQALDQLTVARRKPPTAQGRVGHQQPVERIPCPANLQGPGEPGRRGRVVKQQPIVVGQVGHRRPRPQADAPRLDEELHLQQAGG